MGDDGGPFHIEVHVEGPEGEWPRPGPSPSPRRLARGPRRWTGWVALVALAGLVAGGLLVWLGGGDDRDADERRPSPDDAAPAEPPRVTWARAANRLQQAGSFAYRGTARAREPNAVRPGTWLAGEVTVEGAVVLPGSISREVATDRRGRAVETVTSGPLAWSRTRRSTGGGEAARWVIARSPEPVPFGRFDASRPTQVGPALLAEAVRLAGNRRSDPPDGSGRRTLRGTAQFDAPDDNHLDDLLDGAEVVLVLDDDGTPVRIRLTTTPADDPRLVVDVAVDRVGERDLITPADVEEPVRRTLPTDVLEAAGVRALELGQVPSGWGLVGAEVWPGCRGERCGLQYGQSCPALHLSYSTLAPPSEDPASGGGLSLSIASETCRRQVGTSDWGEPIRAGAFSGTVNEEPSFTQGSVSDGATTVDFATGLPAEDAARVLSSLVPFDPARGP